MRIWNYLSKAWKWIFYFTRISFGIMLLISISIIALAIIALIVITSNRQNSQSQSGNSFSLILITTVRSYTSHFGHGHYGFRPFSFNDLLLFFILTSDERRHRRYVTSQNRIPNTPIFNPNSNPNPNPRPQPSLHDMESGNRRTENEMNLLESIYSFLFGDGNPNRFYEKRRLVGLHYKLIFQAAIVALIRHNQGVVIAEQVKPFLDEFLLETEYSRFYFLLL